MSSQTWRGKREAKMSKMIEGGDMPSMGYSERDTLYSRKSNIKDDTKKMNEYIKLEPKPEYVKILQVDSKSDFERQLNILLADNWIINPGESLKIYNRTYTILLVRKVKEDKSYI